jgi:hypothetical protein
MKTNSLIPLKCTEDSFYRLWVEFLAPFHKLTTRERDVAARIIAQYIKLRKNVSDPAVLEEVLWSQTSRKDMRESLGMSTAYFQMVLGKLREIGMITQGGVHPKYVPHMTDEPRYMLSILFDWSSAKNPIVRDEPKQD